MDIKVSAFLVIGVFMAVFTAVLGVLGWLLSRWYHRRNPRITQSYNKPVKPSAAFIAGAIVSYGCIAIYLATPGLSGTAMPLVRPSALVAFYVLTCALAIAFEIHVYKPYRNLHASGDIERDLAEYAQKQSRLAQYPRSHFAIAAVIGAMLGYSIAKAIIWLT